MLTRKKVWTGVAVAAVWLLAVGALLSPWNSWGGLAAWLATAVLIFTIPACQLAYVRHRDSARAKRLAALWRRPAVRGLAALLALPLGIAWMVLLSGGLSGTGGSVLASMLDTLYMGLMISGMLFISLAFIRGGDEPRCAGCEYLLEGAPEGGFERCPECGADLRASSAIATGQKVIVKPMVAVGAAMVIVAFVSIGRVSRGSGSVVPYLPTGALIKEVTAAPRGFTNNEWAELTTRSLTQGQREALFEGMLELRERKGFVAREAEAWMDQTAMAGDVPEALVERYYAGMLRLWLAAPEVVNAASGTPVRFGIGGDFRGNIHVPASSVLRVWFVPDELLVEGQPAAMHNDPRRPIYGISMGTTDRGLEGLEPNFATPAQRGPVGEFDAASVAGDSVALRATGWLYVAPYTTVGPAAGQSVPADAVWSTRVDLSKTVRIER